MLDPIPASVLKNCYDLLLPFITNVGKCSLQNSTLTSDMKKALVRPSLKKPSLDYQLYKNHRPISNLMFLSKCEKVVASQFISHLRENKLEEIFQSAYKVGHSTESALLRVHNDVLRAPDDGKCDVGTVGPVGSVRHSGSWHPTIASFPVHWCSGLCLHLV